VALFLVACTFQEPPDSFRQPTATGSGSLTELSDATLDFTNEQTPKTVDSLETTKMNTGAPLSVAWSGSSIIIGDPAAPRTLQIFSDYDCFYCRKTLIEDLPWIERTYVAAGQLKIERVLLPFTNSGEMMARAALCAMDSKRFRELDRRFAVLPAQTEKELLPALKNVKLGQKVTLQCMNWKKTFDRLAAHRAKAATLGIERVPAFVLEGKTWIGVLTREELQQKMEKALEP